MYTAMVYIGIAAYLIIFIVFLTGIKAIKVKFKTHKALGITAAIVASVHALSMIYYYFLT